MQEFGQVPAYKLSTRIWSVPLLSGRTGSL